MRRAPSVNAAFRQNMRDVVRSYDQAAFEIMRAGERELPGLLRAELSQPGSGFFYPSRRRDGSKHQASAPGEPPAPDTGKYRASVFAKGYPLGKGTYSIGVGSPEPYAELLENGGINDQGKTVLPRPHYQPVLTRWIAGRLRPMVKSRVVANERQIQKKGPTVVKTAGPSNIPNGGGVGIAASAGIVGRMAGGVAVGLGKMAAGRVRGFARKFGR